MNKKGSLELSIQAIIIIVIAFVVLGLGLGFVRNQFGSIEETTGSVQEQIRQQVLDDLRTGNKKLSFPASSLNIEKGESRDIAIGVKNTGNDKLNYKIKVETTDRQGGGEFETEIEYFYDEGKAELAPTESRVHSVKIGATGDQATYLVKLRIIKVDENDAELGIYDEKTFFVTIT